MSGLVAGLLLLGVFALAAHAARPRSPFTITPAVEPGATGTTVRLKFFLPPEHVLYAERLKFVNDDGDAITGARLPVPIVAIDKTDGHEKKMFATSFVAELVFPLVPTNLTVKFQGCSNSACYFPEKRAFHIAATGATSADAPVASAPETPGTAGWVAEAAAFKVVSRETGYLGAGKFIGFLDQALSGGGAADPLARFKSVGIAVTMLLILLGGVGLNLTPCVLPLIPINLAIIHGGRAAQSKRAGFLHGAAYGSGMALAYGMLGLIVVLTGSKFGALNSSIWFNIGIALVFVVMALAMFDVLHVDFARFDRGLGRRESRAARGKKSQWLVAFTLGAVAALLAGACVAPVVISVLLLATNLYGNGAVFGLALPFLLGLGMALPWPFMGASLSFLPKPGKWMVRVKHAFGVLIFLFAGYYAHTAWGIHRNSASATAVAGAPRDGSGAVVADSDAALVQALRDARAQGRPVFIDFAASWCKNCVAMDETVFNQQRVKDRLRDFVVVRYEAEKPNEPPAKGVLDHFQVLGLPTYVVLRPAKAPAVREAMLAPGGNQPNLQP
jgi:thiol:disulfide interchange protein